MLEPGILTAELPGLAREAGATIKARPEDFVVREELAYAADGVQGGPHLLFTLTKRGLNTHDAVGRLAKHCGVPAAEFGVAGLKDRHAVTTQWISAPNNPKARAGLETFAAPDIELGPPTPHANKIKRGHARANAFAIVVRGVVEDWRSRLDTKLAALIGGVPNIYGAQRFGHGGKNLEAGLRWLASGGRSSRRLPKVVQHAGQSGLFNAYVVARRRAVSSTMVDGVDFVPGDLLQTQRGGLFVSSDATADRPRVASGEVHPTGPIFGAKMPWPAPDSDAERLELELLASAGLDREQILRGGKRIPGSRRRLKIELPRVRAHALHPDQDESSDPRVAIRLEFALPAGAYATVLLRELLADAHQRRAFAEA